MKKELEVRSKDLNKFRALELELQAKMEDYGKSLEDQRARVSFAQRKLEGLTLQELE